MAESSTVARWELALRIKKRRDELGIKADQIARELGFTRNFFSAVENERAMLAPEKLEILMELLQFDAAERHQMQDLDRIGRLRGWWESHEEILGPEAVRYLGLEQGASEICIFESLAVAGIVQTQEYMKAVFDRDPAVGRIQTQEMVQLRKKRQDSILGSSTKVRILLSEASLVQIWATSELQVAQLHRVLDLVTAGKLEIRVLPFDRSPGPIATSSTLNILDFNSTHLPSLIWQEPLRSVGFVREGDEPYQRIRIAWEEGYESALDANESKDKILAIATKLA